MPDAVIADSTALILGVAVCWLGAIAYLFTFHAIGAALGSLAGLMLALIVLRPLDVDPRIFLGAAAGATILGGALGLALARKANWFIIAGFGAAVGFGAASLVVGAYAASLGWDNAERLIILGGATVFSGAIFAMFQRQFLMLVAATLGGLIVVTSFHPCLPLPWLGGTVAASLAAQSATIGLFRRRRSRNREEDDDDA